MSWLLNKVTGGLLGSAYKPEQSQHSEEEEDDSSPEPGRATGPDNDSDVKESAPIDWSSLTITDGDELCRAVIKFGVWQSAAASRTATSPLRSPSKSQPTLSIKSNNALLVLYRVEDSYDTKLNVFLSPSANPVVVADVTGALWKNVDFPQHVLEFGLQENGQLHVFFCQFHNHNEEKIVSVQWSVAVWEHAQQDSFAKQIKNTDWLDESELESKYEQQTIKPIPEDDLVFMSDDDDDDSSVNESEESDTEPEVNTRHRTPIRGRGFQLPRTLKPKTTSHRKNDKLALGITSNRAYVGGGSDLGVFSLNNDGQLDLVSSFDSMKSRNGTVLNPNQMMLHDTDSKMLMLDSSQSTKVFEMDIERGQIVNEYQATDDDSGFNIRSIGHRNKYSQATGESTILGVNKNTVFSLDPRLNTKSKLAQSHTYKTGNMGMSSLTTTGTGHVAVGSDKGEIRLYNDISKIAKTRLPGLGDPIIGLDVTESGEWLLATTAYYILLIQTTVGGEAKDGFNKSITSAAKAPIKLQLSRQHMLQFNISDALTFTPAHFDTGSNIHEQWIIAALGPFIVTWNFRKIKSNPLKHRDDYTIARCVENVVADQFAYGQRDKVVVTTEGNVFTEKRVIKK